MKENMSGNSVVAPPSKTLWHAIIALGVCVICISTYYNLLQHFVDKGNIHALKLMNFAFPAIAFIGSALILKRRAKSPPFPLIGSISVAIAALVALYGLTVHALNLSCLLAYVATMVMVFVGILSWKGVPS